MSLWLAIAAKPPALGKSRLAGVLGSGERERLCHDMAEHTITVAVRTIPPERCLLVTPSPDLWEIADRKGVSVLSDRSAGMNAAFALATRYVARRGATALLTLSADLPWLHADDLRALMAADGDLVIAPDRHGTGTNALLMRPPGRVDYCYGERSYSRHRAVAERADVRVVVVRRAGLACDLDTPMDLPAPPFSTSSIPLPEAAASS